MGIGHFDLSLGKYVLLAWIRPVLLGLVASLGVVEGTEHDHHAHILVVRRLPEIIERFNRRLAEDSEDIAIDQ